MSHFLARLVERARGTAPRVEPIVAPRFAPIPIVEIASEVETPSLERSDHQRTVKEKSSPREVVQQEAPAEKPEAKILRESEKSLPQQPEKLLVPMERSTVDSTAFVRPSPSVDRPVPAIQNGIARRNSFTASRSKRPRPAIPLTTTSRNLEGDLLTPNEFPEQAPIVCVTIGRIDVRATPPAVPSRKSSTRSEPKLTLDAYLKSRREGMR
jgi:hypothetical protein